MSHQLAIRRSVCALGLAGALSMAESPMAKALPTGPVPTGPLVDVITPDEPAGPSEVPVTIVDDLDSWEPFFSIPGVGIPFPGGVGFLAGGPQTSWYRREGTADETWDEHAHFTFGATVWGGRSTNNWAVWAPDLPSAGWYEVRVFVPAIFTDAVDTSYARYLIGTAQGVVQRVVDQNAIATRGGDWTSLGTFPFQPMLESPPAYVELRDVVTDAAQRRSVLADAIAWERRDGPPASGSADVDAYLEGRPDGAVVREGDVVRYGYRVSPAGTRVRVTYCYQGDCFVQVPPTPLPSGYCCWNSRIGPDAGERIITAEALDASGNVLDSDTTSYNVIPTTPPCSHDAAVVAVEPVEARPGETIELMMAFENVGSCTWHGAEGVRLLNVSEPLGANAIQALTADVPPGGLAEFAIAATAPNAEGVVLSGWRMDRQTTGSFGDTAEVEVIVLREAPAPVVFLPGILGSTLDNEPRSGWSCALRAKGEVWPPVRTWTGVPVNWVDQHMDTLLLNDDAQAANECDAIEVGLVLDQLNGKDFNADFVARLRQAGHVVRTFAYDWRYDVDTNITALDAAVKALHRPDASQVVLVGHSMGGLVARLYVSDAARARHVRAVVSIGTPYLGSPVIAGRLLKGEVGHPQLDGLLSNDLGRRLGRSWPAAMVLLPSRHYFELPRETGYLTYRDAQNGRAIAIQGHAMTTRHLVRQESFKQHRLDAAATYHERAGTFSSNLHAPIIALMGTQLDTAVHWTERAQRRTSRTSWEPTSFAAGDGSVPRTSAEGVGGTSPFVRRCPYAKRDFADPATDHGALLSDANIIRDVAALVRDGTIPATCSAGRLEDLELSVAAPAQNRADLLTIGVAGSVYPRIVERASGRSTGWMPDGTLRWELDDVQVAEDDDYTHFTVVMDADRELVVTPRPEARGDGASFDVQVIRHDAGAGDEGSLIVGRAMWTDVVLRVSDEAALNLAVGRALVDMRLQRIDVSGLATERAPDAVVDGAAAADFQPPRTETAITGVGPRVGLVWREVEITLIPTDDVAGVLFSEISLDGGRTWRRATRPYRVRSGDTTSSSILARSIDRAGNVEFPAVAADLELVRTVHLPIGLIGVTLGGHGE